MSQIPASSPDLLAHIMAAHKTGIVVCDLGVTGAPVLYMNDLAAEILMVPVEGALKKSFEETFSLFFAHTGLQKKMIEMIYTPNEGSLEFQKGSENSPVWYRMKICAAELSCDKAGPLVFSFEDISELKLRDAQLSRAQRLEGLGLLTGGVVHDFNNLMSIIGGYTGLARKENKDDPVICSHLDKINKAVQRGTSLTRRLSSYGRDTAVVETIADLGALVEDQKILLDPLVNDSVRTDFLINEHVSVECTPENLTQILMNLVINACDAMPRGGDLTIEVLCKNPPANIIAGRKENSLGYGCLRVTDTGVGMPEKIRQHVFDPFFTTKDQGKGTGLGLSVVHGLMRQMNGFVTVDSAPGRGTAFQCYFPLSDKRPVQKIDEAGDRCADVKLEGATTLVAEDEPDLLELIGSMLEQMGVRVIKAQNGNDALLKQEEFNGNIDFLLTDLVMPKMNGVRLSELFETARPNTKTVYMSGYPAGNGAARIELPEGAYMLPKPVTYDRLAYILRRMRAPGFESTLEQMAGQPNKG